MRKTTKCNKCQAENLIWIQSKKGNWYLSDPDYISFGLDGHKLINFAHKCIIKSDLPKSYKEVQIKEVKEQIDNLRKVLEGNSEESVKAIVRDLLISRESELKEIEAN